MVMSLSIIIVILVIGSVLWFINREPDFPDISYVPNNDWGEVDWSKDSSDNPELSSFLETFDEAPKSGEVSIEPLPQISKEERLKAINQKYKNAFQSLEKFYEIEINRLIEFAKRDYQAAKDGLTDVPISTLVSQYYQAGRNLEKNSDQRFNYVLEEMKKELKTYGLSMEVINQIEKEYTDQKNSLRKEILSKGKGIIND